MDKSYWADNDIQHLIGYFYQYPNLWNTTHPHFSNRKLRDAQLQWLSEKLSGTFDVQEIHRKWRNLRSQYFSEKKKHKPSDQEAYRGIWRYFDKLTFLTDPSSRTLQNGSEGLLSIEEFLTNIPAKQHDKLEPAVHQKRRLLDRPRKPSILSSNRIVRESNQQPEQAHEVDLHFKALAIRVKKFKSHRNVIQAMSDCFKIVTDLEELDNKK